MKVFLVHKDIYDAGNPYIYTLKESIERNHTDVEFGWGEEIFWSDKLYDYDVIHFHWPAAFLDCDANHHSVEDLRTQLVELKKRGIKIVSTCHDLCPHYTQGASFADAITIVYQMSDAIFHLGEYSKQLFEQQFPDILHLVLPHHLYDDIYIIRPTKDEARKRLGLSLNKKYILCMGAFRAQEERDLVLSLSKKLRHRGVMFIAPAFDSVRTSLKPKFPFITRGFLKYIFYRYFRGILLTGKTWVPISDEELPYYYAACDMALVQRLKILNSGNAVMPLLFNRPVCGPNIGNVGPFLHEYGGYVFDIQRLEDLHILIEEILNETTNNIALEKVNSELKTKVIAEKQYNYYERILEETKK